MNWLMRLVANKKNSQPKHRVWRRRGASLWVSNDNAVVRIDGMDAVASLIRPVSDRAFGWVAYGPGDDEFNAIVTKHPESGVDVPQKFNTARGAMVAVDRKWPYQAA